MDLPARQSFTGVLIMRFLLPGIFAFLSISCSPPALEERNLPFEKPKIEEVKKQQGNQPKPTVSPGAEEAIGVDTNSQKTNRPDSTQNVEGASNMPSNSAKTKSNEITGVIKSVNSISYPNGNY